jgi:Ser/Thr protein kinase RdoA (MazF antagonist)
MLWSSGSRAPSCHACSTAATTVSRFSWSTSSPAGTLEASGAPWPDALTLVGELAARLHVVGRPPEGFVTAREYTDSWRLQFGHRPDLASELNELATPGAGDVLINADLHPGNVLRGGDGWKVIDPHAVCAEPAADIWALLDPLVISLPEEPAAATGEAWERVQRYAEEAGIDGVRAAAWTRLRGLAEATSIDRREGASAEDRAWAARLRRMAEALA